MWHCSESLISIQFKQLKKKNSNEKIQNLLKYSCLNLIQITKNFHGKAQSFSALEDKCHLYLTFN